MGIARDVRCNSCGKRWMHYIGEGCICEYYYCNKCGKEKVYEYDSCCDLLDEYDYLHSKLNESNDEEEKIILKRQLMEIHKQKKKHKTESISVLCECGGNFEIGNDIIIICPDCHSKEVVDDKDDTVLLFD